MIATTELSTQLEIEEGSEVVIRRREMLLEEQAIQLYDSYLPHDLVEGTELARPGFLHQGTYAALERIGHRPVSCSEEVSARMPTPDEAGALHLGEGVPVLEVHRITRGAGGRVLEALHIIAAADRTVLAYRTFRSSEALDLSGGAR